LIKRAGKIGDFDAVIPEISGRAFVTGFNKIVVESDDPFKEGFTVGDIWSN